MPSLWPPAVCPSCKTVFQVRTGNPKPPMYCSVACKSRDGQVPCAECETLFTPQRVYGVARNSYCSQVCSGKGRTRKTQETTATRFWKLVDMSGECWLWLGSKDKLGYGHFSSGTGTSTTASRWAWILIHGSLIRDQYVLHDCPGGDNPSCVRPAHMFVGTPKDNMEDRSRKGKTPNTKLTLAQADEIRRLYANGRILQRDLADRFGVSCSAISFIVNRRTYTWSEHR